MKSKLHGPWDKTRQTRSDKLVRNYLSLHHVSPCLTKSRFTDVLIARSWSRNACWETTRTTEVFRCSIRLCLLENQVGSFKPKRISGYANDKGTHGRSITTPLTWTKGGRSRGIGELQREAETLWWKTFSRQNGSRSSKARLAPVDR